MEEFASSPCMLGEFGIHGPAPLVTRAVPAEAAEIAAVLLASIRELCVADHGNDPVLVAGWTANKTAEQVSAWIADEGQDLLVSRDREGAPIACVGAANARWILLNYVAPAHRGRGHSSAMLAALEAALVRRGVRTAELMSTQTAHAFYLARGWRDAGIAPCRNAGTLSGHRMVKDLAP